MALVLSRSAITTMWFAVLYCRPGVETSSIIFLLSFSLYGVLNYSQYNKVHFRFKDLMLS
jgi:hypothetical protein